MDIRVGHGYDLHRLATPDEGGKPMVIGGISKTKEIIDIVKSDGKRANISSLIESNVGRLTYLHMSAAFEIKEECGIATNTLFKSDISDFPATVKGKVNINNKPGIALDKINLSI